MTEPQHDSALEAHLAGHDATPTETLRAGLLPASRPDLRHLYMTSAQFHAAIDSLIGAAPFLVDALAQDAQQAEAAHARMAAALEREPPPPFRIGSVDPFAPPGPDHA